MNRRLLDYLPLYEAFDGAAPAAAPSQEGALGFGTVAELELASELLDVSGERELDGFIRRLLARAGLVGARIVRSPMAPQVIGELKRGARLLLGSQPLGDRARAARLAGAARVFGLELEGLSPEDKEFTLARQYVRFAGAVVRYVGGFRGPPAVAARFGLRHAARRFAPGLLVRSAPAGFSTRSTSF